MLQDPCISPSAGVPAAPLMSIEDVTPDTDPAPETVMTGEVPFAVATTSATTPPLAPTRSTSPGALTVPAGKSSHVHWTSKFMIYPPVPRTMDSEV
jgi:hypothetical protein